MTLLSYRVLIKVNQFLACSSKFLHVVRSFYFSSNHHNDTLTNMTTDDMTIFSQNSNLFFLICIFPVN